MRPAWTPMALVLTGSLLVPGCDPSTFRAARTNRGPSAAASRVTSDPAGSRNLPQEGADSDVRTASQQIERFLSQFRPQDREAHRIGTPPAPQPTSAPPPPPGFTKNQARVGMTAPLDASPRLMTAVSQPPGTAPAAGAMTAIEVGTPPPRPGALHAETVASPDAAAVLGPVATSVGPPSVELIEVRAVTPAAAPGSQPAAPGANQPVTPTPAAPAASLDALVAQLEAAIRLNPQEVDDQFRLRLLYAVTGQDDRATGPIEGVDPVQGELIAAVLRAVVAARKAMQDPVHASAPAIAAAEELRRLVGQQSSVIVPRLALVTRVNSYGDYEAVNPPRFPSGQPVHVFLYTEVKNFRSETTDDNRLKTVLGEKVEIFDASGKVVWERTEPNIEDRTHSPRSDFFMTMEIELPASLPAGDYVLKVTVEDKLGATMDQQRLSFSLGAN